MSYGNEICNSTADWAAQQQFTTWYRAPCRAIPGANLSPVTPRTRHAPHLWLRDGDSYFALVL